MKSIDLTKEKEFLITFKVDGNLYAYSKTQLERLVKIDQREKYADAPEADSDNGLGLDNLRRIIADASPSAWDEAFYKPKTAKEISRKFGPKKSYAAIGKKVSLLYKRNSIHKKISPKEGRELEDYLVRFDGELPKRYGSKTPGMLREMIRSWEIGGEELKAEIDKFLKLVE